VRKSLQCVTLLFSIPGFKFSYSNPVVPNLGVRVLLGVHLPIWRGKFIVKPKQITLRHKTKSTFIIPKVLLKIQWIFVLLHSLFVIRNFRGTCSSVESGPSPRCLWWAKPPNWNMKHYKSVEFCRFLHVKPRCTNVKSPCWRLSGDGSGQNANGVHGQGKVGNPCSNQTERSSSFL